MQQRARQARNGTLPIPMVRSKRASGRGARATKQESASEGTPEKILSAAVKTLVDRGARAMSMTDVCARAGVSRGTLYRYFPSKDDLLNAMALHLRGQADTALEARTAKTRTPSERLKAVFQHIDEFIHREQSTRLMQIEPGFAIDYYRRNLSYLTGRTARQLGPVFDDWEARLGAKLDREFLTEMLIRYAISQVIVPCGYRNEMATRVAKLIEFIERK